MSKAVESIRPIVCLAACLLSVAPHHVCGAAPETRPAPDPHASLKTTIRPGRQASELTQSLASRLPSSSEQRADRTIVRRNLVDERLFGRMARDGVPHAPLTSDYEFARRVHLDLTGRIPQPERLEQFIRDPNPSKRDQLTEELLASDAWVDHWAYWFGDLFRNCANRIGDPATKHFDSWVRRSLRDDKPYDQWVTEMLIVSAPQSNWVPDAAPTAFLARWHVAGDTMYSDRFEDTADEIAVQSARLFLGVNYQCISCHGGKGFLEKVNLDLVSKKRSDFWSMAAFFGDTRVRIVPFQDRFTITEDGTGYDTQAASSVRLQRRGGDAPPVFLLTGEKADPTQPLRPQFARMLTRHPQFARATVNRFWKEFFGLGIVDPVDSFDLARLDPAQPPPAPWTTQPTDTVLLEAMARDFAAHGFRLKHLMRQFVQSSAYQLSSRFDAPWEERYTPYFARHYVRLLTAEQLHDAITQATGSFPEYKHKDMIFGTPLPEFRYWTEAASPEQIGNSQAKAFMLTFGQANREQSDRRPGGSVLQALTLMNSPFVSDRVSASTNTALARWVTSAKSNQQIVSYLYLATLSRPPTDHETQIAVPWLDENRQRGIEDLQWSLFNKLDFLFNY